MELVTLTHENLDREHICCAISNNKDIQVMSKKNWLKDRLDEGLVFLKGNVRGKCFIEYIPAEYAWAPIKAEGVNEFFPFRLPGIDLIHKIKKHFRLRILQRQIVKFCLNLGYTKPLCNGRIDVHRLPGLFFLLGRRHKLQSPHIMQPVGKLNNNNPNVLCHGKKHLAQILRLNLQFIRRIRQLS